MDFDYTKIHRYPYPIPDGIIDSLRMKKLAFFIGAGVSKLIGCKGWKDFASSLLNECNKKNYINHLEYESLNQENDLKKIITIVHSIFDENNEEKEFIGLFKNSLSYDSDLKKKYDIYPLLKKFDAVYVTTNADSYFDSLFTDNNCIYDFSGKMHIEKEKLYHIHGMESHPESLVFTIEQYLEKYNNDCFRYFLNELFRDYTIVFVGYGLDEYEVLDFLVEKTYDKTRNELKHFFVKAYFLHEDYLLKHERRYFKRLGLNVVAYEKDKLGFSELYRLLESWERECHLSTSMITTGLKEIERMTKSAVYENEIDELMKFIEPRDTFKNYFFAFLSKNITLVGKFFTYFIKNGYFDPRNNPSAEEVKDKSGFFFVPYWNMLIYLIAINNYLKQHEDQEIYRNLKIVIKNLIDSSSKNRNYHTDCVLISLMFSFSESNIENSYIEFLRTALDSNLGNMNVSEAIYKNVIPICLNFKKSKIIDLLEIILDSKEVESSYKKYISLLDGYCLSQIIKNYMDDIYKKLGNKLIDILIIKLEKIADTAIPLFGLDQLSINYAKNQMDETNYDQMIVIALFCQLKNLDQLDRDNYFNKIKKNNSRLFRKMLYLMENANESDIQEETLCNNKRAYSVSPYSVEELLAMDPDDISKAINDKLTDFGWDDPRHRGFVESLYAMIAKAPQKITDSYHSYLHIPPRYINAILFGFLNNAMNKISMNWENVFNYLFEIIKSPDITDIKEEESKNICTMPTLSIAADLIYHYFNGYVVNEKFYIKLREQLIYILSKEKNVDDNLYPDIASKALNTTMGKSYYAMLKLVMFYAEHHDKDINKWDAEIFSFLFPLIESRSANLILCYIFGEYFPLFVWLNKGLMFSNFELMMQNKETEQWNAFIYGYFNSNYEFNSDIYVLLRENNVYKKFMANQDNFTKFNRIKMVEYACIAYFRKIEDIENENSLIKYIICTSNKNDIHTINDFIWGQSEYFKTIDDCDVKKLWSIIVACLSNNNFDNDMEYDNIIAELLSFLSVIKTVDKEVIRCIEFSVSHSRENNLPFYIIPDLTELFSKDSNRDNVLIIMDMLISRDILILYQEEEMRKFVEMICQYNREFASRIINAYLNRGFHFLSDLCN
jgi:hypothetical protein